MNKRIDRNSIESKRDAIDEIFGRPAREGLERLNKSCWIECPVESDLEVELKFGDGETRGPVKAGKAAWYSGLPEKYSITGYRKYKAIPDPHKEWVKIQEGCPMPEEGDDIIKFHKTDGQFFCNVTKVENGRFITTIENGMPYEGYTDWRYPHPDPED